VVTCEHRVESLGDPSDVVPLAHHDVLGEAALTEGRPHHDAEDGDVHSGHFRADSVDHTGEVLADHRMKLVLEHALEDAAQCGRRTPSGPQSRSQRDRRDHVAAH
jgi:hypothetical protein